MKTRIVIVGGFLGAGKTTLLLQSARQLTANGYRVGLVTNDQGRDLVDTALVSQHDFPVVEVAGGCFCCTFPDLLQSLLRLQEAIQPDVILAEPVGSCTDLISTVLRPLMLHHPSQFDLAPLTILVDAGRDLSTFPQSVTYLYERQLAEAELLLLNKLDLYTSEAGSRHIEALQTQYSHARVGGVSSRTGEGVSAWLDIVLGQISLSRLNLDLDYDLYAVAEAELGWLNAKGMVRASQKFSAKAWAENLLHHLSQTLTATHDAPIAHIKLHVTTPSGALKASLTQSGLPPTWDLLLEKVHGDQLEFTLNVRANADPQIIEKTVLETIERVKPQTSSRYYYTHFECFRPLPPRPTHRLTMPTSL